MIQLILASDKNGCIGKAGKLPFKLKHDLKNFAHVTQNTICVMGRKTFDSLPNPLVNRTMIVFTNTIPSDYETENVHFVHSAFANYIVANKWNQDISVIGGGAIYSMFEPYASKIIWTRVHCEVDGGDTFYTPNVQGYNLISSIDYEKNNLNQYDFTIETYVRKQNTTN